MSSFAEEASVVLVHGAWADGSSWSKVVAPLQQAGLKVFCAPIPLTSLAEDAAVVTAVIERAAGPVTLVGHAYAGAVIGAVKHERVKSLVYVAALAPDTGETVADVFNRDPKHADSPELAPDARGFLWMPDSGFEKAFAQHATPAEKAICAAVQRPISVTCIQEPVSTPAWKTVPSWYLVAEGDRMINPDTQRFTARRMGATVHEYAVDHAPSLTAPKVVVEVVVEAARATLGASRAQDR
jgi:pimeloyl-ACP methyl ester carboxylesterase